MFWRARRSVRSVQRDGRPIRPERLVAKVEPDGNPGKVVGDHLTPRVWCFIGLGMLSGACCDAA